MLTQSKETRNAWRASQRTLDIKVTLDGKTYGATDINSLKYDSGAYNGDTFAIGSTYSNTVQIEFSHLVEGLKLGMEVRPSIGIKTSSGYVYEPLGVFIISSEIKMDRNNNLTTVSASDRFCGLEGAYVSKLTYPAKVLDVIAEICAQSGVKANTDDLARLPHQADLPAPITGQSYRKALGWIAQLYVGYALFDRQGLFTIRTISEPNYELDPSQYEQAGLTKNEAAYKINGIQCQVTLTTKTRDGESTEETKTYQAGDATGSQIKLENNIMTPQRLNDIWEQLKDLTFYPFSLNWFGNPAVEAGDWLRLEDKQGNSFVVPNSSYTLDFNGGLSATSKADQATSSDQMVPWQGSVAQTIKELKIRRSPDGTVVFPPNVTAPPTNAKFNDVWFKKNGNSTELWIFEKQNDGSGKWIRKDLSDDEIKKKVADAQQGLNQAKADIINNKQKADVDIENLNKSIEDNKKVADQDIQNLNKSIEANKKVADESLKKLNDSVTNLQGQYDNNIVPNLNKVMADASDALQKYIAAQNSIADLTKQAQQQGKDITEVSNTVKGLNINYANLAGDVNSTKVDVKGLQTTVGTANGDIAQLKLDAQNLRTMLAGKADNTTYTNFVNLTNQALNARLTASDLNGYAKTADVQATANGLRLNIDSVNGRLDNLKIGGRNLFALSKVKYGWMVDSTFRASDSGNVAIENIPLYGNKKLIFSAYDTPFTSSNFSRILVFDDKNDLLTKFETFEAGKVIDLSAYPTADHIALSIALWNQGNNTLNNVNQAQWLKDNRYKLEFGTVATDWTPAPEDVANDITQLSARITANSQQFSSYYTKSGTDSKANTAKTDAINSIKGDANWTGLTNIITNSGFLQSADGFIQKVQQTTLPMFNGGGVNLLLSTQSFDKNWAWDQIGHSFADGALTLSDTNNGNSRMYQGITDNPTGKTFSVSFNARISADCNSDNVEIGVGPFNATKKIEVTGKDFQSYKVENWQWTSTSLYFSFYVLGGKVDISNLKLEYGSAATPYSPNPADLATNVAFTELTQTVNGLQFTVSNNYTGLQTQINQTATAIRGELTDATNGLQTQITATTNGLSSVTGRVGSLESLTKRQVLTSGIDANTMITAGHYFIQSTGNTNVPRDEWCFFDVETAQTTPNRIMQAWRWDSNPTVYTRRSTNGGRTWTEWQRNASYAEYSSLNQTVQGLQSTVSSNYGSLQTQISQTATAIRGELSNQIAGVTNQITATANSFDIKLSNLNGGGINLLPNSGNMSTGWTADGTSIFSVDGYLGVRATGGNQRLFIGPTEDTKGKLLSVSFDACVANDSKGQSVQVLVGPFGSAMNVVVSGNDFKHYKAENWKWNSDYSAFSIQLKNVNDKINIKNIKLEYGSVATPWSPAPTDLATQVAISELAVTINGLQSTVSSNHSDLQSQISQTAKNIRQEVSDKTSGLQTQINQQANNFNVSLNKIQQTDGVNILRGTRDFSGDWDQLNNWYKDGWVDPNGNYAIKRKGAWWGAFQRRWLDVGTYTFSVYYCFEGSDSSTGAWVYVIPNNDKTLKITENSSSSLETTKDKWIKKVYTFTVTTPGTSAVRVETNSNTAIIHVGSYKLEKGYKETPWTTSPYDIYMNPNVVTKVLTSVQDLNNLTLEGNYVIKATNNANSPIGNWLVVRVEGSGDRLHQTISADNDPNLSYTRTFNGWWSAWQRTVTGGNIMAQINMSAGTTLIQNDKIYMDASSTIFSGNAFIPSAAITSLNADKITAGTINGAKVNVINLNANNITAGTLKGSNGKFYLDSGALHVWQNNHDAWIDQNGIHDYDNQRSVWIQKGEINFEHQLGGSMKHTGVILTNSENSNLNGAITIKGDEGFLLSTKNFTTNYWSEQGFSWGTNTAHYVSGSGILGFNNNITVSAGSTDDHSIAALIAGAIPSKNLGNVFGARAQPGVYIYGRNDSNKDHSFVDIKAPASIHLTTLDSYITIGDTTGYERNSDVSINSGNYLTVSADNSINITACSKTKAGLMPRISLSEASTSISGDSITLNAKNYVTLLGSSVSVTGDFGVLGKKNAIVPTSRGMAAINAYETAEYYFGDIGETQTNSNGVVTVMIDPYFLETVNTLVPYQVFLTSYGDGNVWVSSRSANNFTVKSNKPNIHFAWEIKAKRKGYENDRMKIVKGVFNNEQY